MAAPRIFAAALLVLRCVALLAFASAGADIADSKFGYISARREFPGFAVVFEVYLLRIPTVYNLAMDDVMHIPFKLRVENSTLTDARVPTRFPNLTLFIAGNPVGGMETELYTWSSGTGAGSQPGWESAGSWTIPIVGTGMGPGWWKFGMEVDAPDLSGLALSSVDSQCGAHCTGGSGAGGVRLTVPWDVRILKTEAAAPRPAAAPSRATAPPRRSAAPLGRWGPGLFPLRQGGQGVVNESMSRVAWDTAGARVARMCRGGERGGGALGGLGFVIDALSPDSIVHLAAGSAPELECELRAVSLSSHTHPLTLRALSHTPSHSARSRATSAWCWSWSRTPRWARPGCTCRSLQLPPFGVLTG